jgi:eukaryotic-like serine/threonine-protein kinase
VSSSTFGGGKEELRALLFKAHMLRVRAEKGEVGVANVLREASLEMDVTDGDRGWISQALAFRLLKAIAAEIGLPALRDTGKWGTSPEVLGGMVRMLRGAKAPVDAYLYLARNARESTRVGNWEIELPGQSPAPADTADPPKNTVSAPAAHIASLAMIYTLRTDADDMMPLIPKEEKLLCDARRGELVSYPRIWGLQGAALQHTKCIARGDRQCRYDLRWASATTKHWMRAVVPVASALFAFALFGFAGTWITGTLGALIAGGVGFAGVTLLERARAGAESRVFEAHRLQALERGLDMKGEVALAPVGELAGTVLGGKYRIGRKIGSGGIGVVYAAEHTTLGHEVAVKVLKGAAAKDASEIARLRREAKIQTHIEHPNVARVLDLDQMPDGSIYVVMERLLGRSLADKLGRDGLLAAGVAVPVFVDVCRALGAAHAKGVVHRDLKPGNVFLCADKTAKVLDFGMSKMASAEALTQQGFTLGTPEYMAPEQCIGGAVEPRTDLYAFGVLMYESLTGELPIRAENRRDLLDLHQRQVPTGLREKRPDLGIPGALDRLVMQCLEKRIGDRPVSAMALGDALAAIPHALLAQKLPARGASAGGHVAKHAARGDNDATIAQNAQGARSDAEAQDLIDTAEHTALDQNRKH